MSSKFLHGFNEESSELQRQIGCMTGIFQMFDRHNLLGGRRFNGRHKHKLQSGISLVDVSNPGADSVACSSPRLVIEKNLSKNLSENQRMSMESSRTSFSSSPCSSFSSVDCNKSALQEPVSFNQAIKSLPKNSEPDARSARQSAESPKVVIPKEEFSQPVSSCRDSPRPAQLSKTMDGSYVIGIDGKPRPPLDLNESFRVLMKLKEAPWSFSKIMEPSLEAKGGPNHRASRDGRRLSYDGRDISSNLLDSRENGRTASRLKELPRLSLDSRESSMRSCNSLVKDSDSSGSNKEGGFTSPSSRNELRKDAPGVVAKLMGLESMPSSRSTLVEPMEAGNQILNKSLRSPKEARPAARAAIEPAPWKQQEKLRVPQNAFDSRLKQHPETVYSEIEKRLTEIEFRHGNSDLRALKQILGAMQAKGLLESKKNEEQCSPKPACNNSNHQVSIKSGIGRRPPLPSPTKGSSASKAYESPIVIMKPARSLDMFDLSSTSVIPLQGFAKLPMIRTNESFDKKKLPGSSKLAREGTQGTSPRINGKTTEENGHRSRLRTELGSSNKAQQSSRESCRGFEKSSSSVSPRLQQRKVEVERQMHSSVSSSDSSINAKLSASKQLSDSVSPRTKARRRSTRGQGHGDQESKESRNSSLQEDEISHGSDSNMDPHIASKRTTDVSSSSKQGAGSPSTHLNSPVAPEQPSPVSVLDATFYQDDLPASEVMRSPKISEGPNSDNLSGEKKLESIGNLLQKLEELNSTGEGAPATDHIASLCKTQSQDHRYISETLLASGLLMKDLSSAALGSMPIRLHPSGHPINPDLFLVLEQTKASQAPSFDTGRLHRKLLFDAVNEVLVQKLEAGCSSSSHRKLRGSVLSGRHLLKEVCSEIDQLRPELSKAVDSDDEGSTVIGQNVLWKSLEWSDFRSTSPAIVLDIERAIFKDLVDEIVNGEASSLKQKCGRRRRQLFAK